MKAVVDTNVPITANKGFAEPSDCATACAAKLQDFMQGRVTLVLDDDGRIVNEYIGNIPYWPPSPGNVFLAWVLTNQCNASCVERVPITLISTRNQPEDYAEFPNIPPSLAKFDPSDRKFVAVVCAHGDRPPVLVADDTDWWEYEKPLKAAGITVEFLCPDLLKERVKNPERKKARVQKSE